MEDKQTCFGCIHSRDFAPDIISTTCMDKCRGGSQFEPFTYGDREAQSLVARGKELDDELTEAIEVEDCSDGCRADCQECVDNADKMEPKDLMELSNCSYWDEVFYCSNRTCEGKCSGGDCPPPNGRVADDAKTDDDGVLRSFDTGATRDTGGNKLVFNKFLSAQAIEQYCRYMNMNRLQSDGKLRDGDNWKKGIPMPVYIDSRHRHNHEAWKEEEHRGDDEFPTRQHEVEYIGRLCGILFNTLGYLHEWLKIHDMVMFDEDEPTHEMKERQDAIKSLDDEHLAMS